MKSRKRGHARNSKEKTKTDPESPRFADAMRSLGITMEDLVYRPLNDFKGRGPLQRKIFEHHERKREKLYQEILKKRKKIIAKEEQESARWATVLEFERERTRVSVKQSQKELQALLANMILKAKADKVAKMKEEEDLRRKRDIDKASERLRQERMRSRFDQSDARRDKAMQNVKRTESLRLKAALRKQREADDKHQQYTLRVKYERQELAKLRRAKDEIRRNRMMKGRELERRRVARLLAKQQATEEKLARLKKLKKEQQERKKVNNMISEQERQFQVQRAKRIQQYERERLQEKMRKEQQRMTNLNEYKSVLISTRIQLQEDIRLHRDGLIALVEKLTVADLGRLSKEQLADLGFPPLLVDCLANAFQAVRKQFPRDTRKGGPGQKLDFDQLAQALAAHGTGVLSRRSPRSSSSSTSTSSRFGKSSGRIPRKGMLRSSSMKKGGGVAEGWIRGLQQQQQQQQKIEKKKKPSSSSSSSPFISSSQIYAINLKDIGHEEEEDSEALVAVSDRRGHYLPTSGGGGGGGGGGRTPRGRISATIQRRNAASSLRKVQSARPKITSSSSASSPSIMASSRDPRIVPSTDSLTAMQQRHEMEVLALTEKESSKEDERKKLLACVTGDERRTLLKMYKREREEMNNKIAALGHRQSQELMEELVKLQQPDGSWELGIILLQIASTLGVQNIADEIKIKSMVTAAWRDAGFTAITSKSVNERKAVATAFALAILYQKFASKKSSFFLLAIKAKKFVAGCIGAKPADVQKMVSKLPIGFRTPRRQ